MAYFAPSTWGSIDPSAQSSGGAVNLEPLPFAKVEPILFEAKGTPRAFVLGYGHVFKIARPKRTPPSKASRAPSNGFEDLDEEYAPGFELAFEIVEQEADGPQVAPPPEWFASPVERTALAGMPTVARTGLAREHRVTGALKSEQGVLSSS